MHISQEQIDLINNKYTSLDVSAFNELMKRSYYKYLYNVEQPPPYSKYTENAKKDIMNILENNPDFNAEETLMRLTCQFEVLFKKTFSNLI